MSCCATRGRATCCPPPTPSSSTRRTTLTDRLRAQEERAEEIRNCRMRADEYAARILQWREADARPREDAFGEGAAPDVVRWVELYPQSAVLYVTPLDVARIFRAQMDGAERAWVFTSATL